MIHESEPCRLRCSFNLKSGSNVALGWCGIPSRMLVSQGERAAVAPQHRGQYFADRNGRRVRTSLADQINAMESKPVVRREHKQPLAPSSQERGRGERNC